VSGAGVQHVARVSLLLLVLAGGCAKFGRNGRPPAPPKSAPAPGAAKTTNVVPLLRPRLSATVVQLAATNEWRSIPVAPAPSTGQAPVAVVAPPAPPSVNNAAAGVRPGPPVAPPPLATNAAPPSESISGAYRLRVQDPLIIHLRGILPRDEQFEMTVDDGGYVKLPLLSDRIRAAGLTMTQLEDEIERQYIEVEKIYRRVAVSVTTPMRSYFVSGEVKQPGRMPLVSRVTLLQAIAQAGDYTEFADREKITLVRGGKTTRYNAKELEKYPDRDVIIEAGDQITVGRGFF